MGALLDYLAMDGFAWFIWPAYAVTLGFMGAITVMTLRGLKADRKTLAELEQQAPHRQRKAQAAAARTPGSGQP